MNAKTCKKLRRLARRRTQQKETSYIRGPRAQVTSFRVSPTCFRGQYLWLKKQHASRTLQT